MMKICPVFWLMSVNLKVQKVLLSLAETVVAKHDLTKSLLEKKKIIWKCPAPWLSWQLNMSSSKCGPLIALIKSVFLKLGGMTLIPPSPPPQKKINKAGIAGGTNGPRPALLQPNLIFGMCKTTNTKSVCSSPLIIAGVTFYTPPQ